VAYYVLINIYHRTPGRTVSLPNGISFFQKSKVKSHFSHKYLYFIAFDVANCCFMIFIREIRGTYMYVGTARSQYGDSLQAGPPENQILVRVRFSAPIQTGPGTFPAFYAMGTWLFPLIKRSERCVNHPRHLPLSLKKELSSSAPLYLRGRI
jgi:hypothetical protein